MVVTANVNALSFCGANRVYKLQGHALTTKIISCKNGTKSSNVKNSNGGINFFLFAG